MTAPQKFHLFGYSHANDGGMRGYLGAFDTPDDAQEFIACQTHIRTNYDLACVDDDGTLIRLAIFGRDGQWWECGQ